jgi:hypothetical protein
MDESDFEGSLVLERLALIDRVDEFFDAVDADDVAPARALMRQAGLDEATIAVVERKIANAEH